jgi:hypothetical protein
MRARRGSERLQRASGARAGGASPPRIEPLRAGERPAALLASAAVAAALAVAVAVGTLTVHGVRRHGAFVPGGVFLTVLLLALAAGMVRRRYWAVLGFQALLVVQILAAALGLVFVESWYAAVGWLAALALGGVLFWKLVRVMARVQAGEMERARAGESEPPPLR